MIIEGRTWKFGDNINTDVIIPARYLRTTDKEELARYVFYDVEPRYYKKAKEEGRIIVAGKNFGCGSSREHAVIALKYSGTLAVIARSFARIFFRNAINLGLPVIIVDEVDKISQDDYLRIDFNKGRIENKTKEEIYDFKPYPKFIMEIISCGGIVNYIKNNKELW